MVVERIPNVGSDSFLPPTTRYRSGAFFEGESALDWAWRPGGRGLKAASIAALVFVGHVEHLAEVGFGLLLTTAQFQGDAASKLR